MQEVVVAPQSLNYRLFPRPPASGRIPGGNRMPNAAAGDRAASGLRLTTSIRALARPMAGTTQLPQLHCIPCQANLPMFWAQVVFGQVSRPDSGASSGCAPYTLSEESPLPWVVFGKRDGRIQVKGCRKTCAHSVPIGECFLV